MRSGGPRGHAAAIATMTPWQSWRRRAHPPCAPGAALLPSYDVIINRTYLGATIHFQTFAFGTIDAPSATHGGEPLPRGSIFRLNASALNEQGTLPPPPPATAPAAMLCPALLCYAMLCYALLCYAMLCYAMLCHAMLCCAVLCYAMLCHAMLCCAVLCYAMLCCAMLC